MLQAHFANTLLASHEDDATWVRSRADGMREGDRPLLDLGTVLAGSYEVRAMLGSGGMAQVFDAHDLHLDRRVAVKVARPWMAEALRAEGKALATVMHRSVVGVFHSGVHAGHQFLVIERIEGPTLRAHFDEDLRRQGPLSIAAVVSFARQMAEALAVVHGVGLSHRDIKPDNVMLSGGDRLVLTDFGLTRSELLRTDDYMSGTPHYMAPEVITGAVRPGAGHLVDLYALGIVVYEMLVGRTPFEREQWAQTLHAHLFEPPPDPRALRSDVPDALARLVLDLLAKDPEARPASAGIVAWALREPLKWPAA